MKRMSIVVPCYNEMDAIPLFYNEVLKVHREFDDKVEFEIIFVDDGSSDDTLNVIKKLNSNDKSVQYVSFSRNFGKESAMFAGLEKASGDIIAIMDVDLQDPPSLLPKMYDYIVEGGYDCVATRRVTRSGEPVIRSFFARCFYKMINKLSKTQIVDGARDYRVMTRQMVDAILKLKEYNRFSKGIFSWVGFKTKWLEYENVKRVAGETKWSFWKLFIYSLDGTVAFSTVPLAIASVLGSVMCILSLIWVCIIVSKTIFFGESVTGYPSMMCAIVFIGGIQLLCVGILGQYVAKMYLETKKRPIYITKEES